MRRQTKTFKPSDNESDEERSEEGVRAKTRADEVVCITWDCPVLGDWDPHHAAVMRRRTKTFKPSDNESDEERSEDGDIWLKSVRLEGFKPIQYRYFIGRISEYNDEGDTGRRVRINWWEGHIKPRKFSPQDAMVKYQNGEELEPDVFGNYVDFLLVKPMIGTMFSMRQTFQRYWKSTRKPVDVGHRGLGSSYKCKKLVPVRENTVESLQTAAQHGADFVEFDVQLTKDEVPVIYHDFKVLITYRKKKREDLELFEIPVKDLTLDELQSMKLSHPAYQPEHKYEDIQEDDVDPEDHQPFPTLKRVFEGVDRHTGFNIEVKFPQVKIDGSGAINNFFDRNKYIDTILKCVFENHNGRRIVFSSFSPDVCTLLRQKQNIFPVLFLTNGDTPRYVMYTDIRMQSVQMATEMALCAGLLGVDVVSDVLLADMSLIKYVKDAGLVLFVWGEGCNDKEIIQKLKDHKVDGIIYDRIDFYKTDTKESIFKIEEKEKAELVRRIGSVRLEEYADSGTDSQ